MFQKNVFPIYKYFKVVYFLHIVQIHIMIENLNIKIKLIITLAISYQFQTLIQRIDTEFYCGSRGMVYI